VSAVALVVIAKAPVAGRSKTRLCPPCTPVQAAALAEAALRDTLAAVAAAPARRRLVALDGSPDGWLREGLEVVPQLGGGLGARLAAALETAGGPALVVGMDTPQLSAADLAAAAAPLEGGQADAVLGPALDGGYWTIGLRSPDARAFARVPMSSECTCAVQRRRLAELGLKVAMLHDLSDVDTIADARAVAAAAPHTAFASELARIEPDLVSAHAADHEQPVAVAAGGGGLKAPEGARERRTAG
jgi:rSAM/selenodomain-associated transferase 1